MEQQESIKDVKGRSRGFSAGIILAVCLIISVILFIFVFGAASNFENGDTSAHPVQGNYLGLVYKGGPVVCIIIGLFLTTLSLSVERFIAIGRAKGKGNLIDFVAQLKTLLGKNDFKAANALCDEQNGSVAAVVSAGLKKYEDMATTTEDLTKEQKISNIQKSIEEATALELPTMEQNLPVIATFSTLGTLFGLLGTVIGMIRSFSALATAGAPDSAALATGISEALINTALGIATGATAIISYGYFTGKIDNITYAIDEMGFSLAQTFAAKNK
jgi:biopolymer transport protein ExbB